MGTEALRHNGQPVAGWHIRVARTWWQRAVGLLATPALHRGQGLWIAPCGSVHTVGMRYPIDVVFVDASGTVRKLVRRLRPFRGAWCWGAHATLELRAGAIDELGLVRGDTVG